MTHPPRLASWLLEVTLLPDANAIAGDLWEEFQARQHEITRKHEMHRVWYVWQVARSLAPLFFRSWQRASVSRASAALIAAAASMTIPAAALLSVRSFALSQVPLKTTAELSALFAALLPTVLALSVVAGLALGTRVLNSRV